MSGPQLIPWWKSRRFWIKTLFPIIAIVLAIGAFHAYQIGDTLSVMAAVVGSLLSLTYFIEPGR